MSNLIPETKMCRFCDGHYTSTDTCLYLAHQLIDELEADIEHRKKIWVVRVFSRIKICLWLFKWFKW